MGDMLENVRYLVTQLRDKIASTVRKLGKLHELYEPNFSTMSPEAKKKQTEKVNNMNKDQKEHVEAMGQLIRRLEADIQVFYDVESRSDTSLAKHCSECIRNIDALTTKCKTDGHEADFEDVKGVLTDIVSRISPAASQAPAPVVGQHVSMPAMVEMRALLGRLEALG
jgi:hypothetical protein